MGINDLDTAPGGYDAILLDAYGTLIEVDRPFERLRDSVRRHLGADVAAADAERAFQAEMTFYADHCHRGADAMSLAALRAECAEIVLAELGIDADPHRAARILADSIAFRVFADVRPLLEGLAGAGVATAVVSNWDCSLAGTLRDLGVDAGAVFTSAETGSRKPDPSIFRRALAGLGVAPARALHVGDTPSADGVGARAAGVDVRIVDRTGTPGEAGTIGSLIEVLELV